MLLHVFRRISAVCVVGCGCLVQGQVVINEVHYNPDVKTELVEFIELHNAGAGVVDLTGWRLTNAVSYAFPAGSQVSAGGFVVVAAQPAAVQAKFGVPALGPWTGTLSNEGDRIELRDAAGATVDAVSYQAGFPWPTVGDPPGYSMELMNPALDNSLGGSWRASVAGGSTGQQPTELFPAGAVWKYFKGTAEPSSPSSAWQQPGFDDAGWGSGPAPLGYDPAVAFGTLFSDMNGQYSTFYLRRTFVVDDLAMVGSLTLEVMYDDGFKLWINGTNVLNRDMSADEVPYTGTSTGSARESNAYDTFILTNPRAYLHAGVNTVAVQVANIYLGGSSDCFFDARLVASFGSAGNGPTPGAPNAVYVTNAPPQLRQVEHQPEQPTPGVAVTLTAKVTDPDGVSAVSLAYQLVDPGNYIELADAAYATNWTTVAMRDDGAGGDALAQDSVYTVVLPGTLQTHRRLVRYRLSATDGGGRSVTVPYADDPQPNFAYYVSAGVPAWSGLVKAGDATLGRVFTVGTNEMNRLPVIQLLAKQSAVEDATWFSRYGGDAYLWAGTLVYDGQVYDHIHYRARGGVWRYAMCKNMWKFDLNRGHDFRMRDNWGERYNTGWTKLNLGASIQQGDYEHRGEQGMFESVGMRLFQLAGVPGPHTTFVQLRVVDAADEVNAADQYEGDFWGLYLAMEQEDGRFLDEHGLPDGNLYKMEGGTGELNNLAPGGPTDKSDLNSFLNTYNGSTPTEAWWRANLNLEAYFGYQAIVQGIHHYDIADGKNYFYYRNPTDGLWTVVPWDLDLTWANNMYRSGTTGGDEPFKSRVLSNFASPGSLPNISIEFRNRVRELRDLLFNNDEGWRLIDEYAGRLRGPTNSPSLIDADRAQWDYNPKMASSTYSSASSKSGQGRFYRWSIEPTVTKDFNGCVQLMKNYLATRAAYLDTLAADAAIPVQPVLTYTGPTNYPVNRLTFQSSGFGGMAGFAFIRWRIGEVTKPSAGSWQYANRWKYEIEGAWDSGAIGNFALDFSYPAGLVKPGHTYRARVQMADTTGRRSQWSAPIEFVAGVPDNAAVLIEHLRLTELMAAPGGGAEDEFVELLNTSATQTLDLAGAVFTSGIDYTFPAGASLDPGALALVVRTADLAGFRTRHGVPAAVRIFGPWGGGLSDGGETLTLKTAPGGTAILDFTYGNGRGWPVASQAGHSLVPLARAMATQATGALDWPGNWRASAFIGGSPGQTDPVAPAPALILNEVVAHTDYLDPQRPEYDSNDWIELLSVAGASQSLAGFYLSDDPADLRKWALPATNVADGAHVVFDEVSGFHTPITSGFGIDKAGEQIMLSWLPGGAADRVVDAVRFKGQENERSVGRFPDGLAGTFRYPLLRTPAATNTGPLQGLVIHELMYRPADPTGTNDNTLDEFVEILNPLAQSVTLQDTNGAWRLDGGIGFTFPANTTLAPGASLLVVGFDPSVPAQLAAFRATYGLTNPALAILGPFSGKLGNRGDRVALERPQYPDFPDDPDYSWIIVDEVIYGNQDPWPAAANGGGHSLNRISPGADGNDPASWTALAPSPGHVEDSPDRDADGMPNDWEQAHGLNPDDPTDAALDADDDGLTNLQEYRAGTDPRSGSSRLELSASFAGGTTVQLRFLGVAGHAYRIDYRDELQAGGWLTLRSIAAVGSDGWLDTADALPTGAATRFYRLVVP